MTTAIIDCTRHIIMNIIVLLSKRIKECLDFTMCFFFMYTRIHNTHTNNIPTMYYYYSKHNYMIFDFGIFSVGNGSLSDYQNKKFSELFKIFREKTTKKNFILLQFKNE